MKRYFRNHKTLSILFIVAFACIGTYVLTISFAAVGNNIIEPEGNTLANGAIMGSDASASGGSYVQFDAPVVTPPPTTPPTNSDVQHGEELTEAMVGPWTLQNVTKGQEQLDKVARPSRGYWRMDTPDEFVPNGTYTYNNNPSNHGGTLATDTMIDGYLVPAGTRVVQFRDLSASTFYAQGATGNWLFRGVRIRESGVGGESVFNDNNSSYTMNIHYADMGGLGPQDGKEMDVAWKMLGGQNHRVLRTYISYVSTGLQPNVAGVEITENYLDKITFYYGESGPCGSGGSCVYHLNGISSEGMSNSTPTRFKILRNHITVPSPDEAGHLTIQTDCIALFGSNGGSYNDVLVQDNYLGGSGFVIYAAGEKPGAKNVRFIGNKITTRWWTNGGNFGAVAAQATWGSNGNVATGNVWADDYGSGGNGNTPLASRQYPSGNGPRKNQIIFGN